MAALISLPPRTAQAQMYHDWNYAIDALNDGSGGSIYEMRGLAYRVDGNSIDFAISGQFPQGGNPVSSALNGRINYGDFFLNFSNHNLDNVTKFTDPRVYAIRFDPLNDSLGNTPATPNNATGVYGSVVAAGLTTVNSGYGTLQNYFDAGFARTTDAMGDLENSNGDVKNYFSNGVMYPNIASGTRLGDITLLNRTTLTGMGLDFGHFTGADPSGNFVFGFSLDRNILPTGAFTGHVFEECINDGVAIQGANVPEPGMIALLATSTLSGAAFLRRRKQARKAA